MSEQITVTDPSVSTAGSRRITALRPAMRRAPSASETVTTAGRPSGIAATARLTAVRNISSAGSLFATPTTNRTPTTITAAAAIVRPSAARRRWSGVRLAGSRWRSSAIVPISVAMPVATTMPSRAAVGHGGSLERHVAAAGDERAVDAGQRVGGLRGRLRLAGQSGLVDAERMYVEESEIARDDVAGSEPDDVARDELDTWELPEASGPDDASRRRRQLLQRGHRLRGQALLPESDAGVEGQDHDDCGGVDLLADQERDDRRDREHCRHRVRELCEEEAPRRRSTVVSQRVRSEDASTSGDFVVVEPVAEIGVQTGGDLVHVERPRRR